MTSKTLETVDLPKKYAFCVCRIEPENNISLILEAFDTAKRLPLVLVGNWHASLYGRELYANFANSEFLYLVDPIYDVEVLSTLRSRASFYVHGHSAGGTNPSLVEAMHFGIAIAAYDCGFNRYTTCDEAFYFSDKEELVDLIENGISAEFNAIGKRMKEIARDKYVWTHIAAQYFDLIT